MRPQTYHRFVGQLTHRFPLIVDAPCIIDGEAVACDYNGVASISAGTIVLRTSR